MYTLSISTLDENESTKHWDSSSAAYFASVFFLFFVIRIAISVLLCWPINRKLFQYYLHWLCASCFVWYSGVVIRCVPAPFDYPRSKNFENLFIGTAIDEGLLIRILLFRFYRHGGRRQCRYFRTNRTANGQIAGEKATFATAFDGTLMIRLSHLLRRVKRSTINLFPMF